MALLDATKTYADGSILTELDLDNLRDSWHRFFNVIKVSSDNIQAASLDSTLFASACIESQHFAAGAVSTAKILANAVTPAKRSAVNRAVGTGKNGYSVPNDGVLYTLDTCTLSASGVRPVLVGIAPYGNTCAMTVSGPAGDQTVNLATRAFKLEDATFYSKSWPGSMFWFIDLAASAGNNTYTWTMRNSRAGTTITVYGKVFALEL